jgi:hypothetical protein
MDFAHVGFESFPAYACHCSGGAPFWPFDVVEERWAVPRPQEQNFHRPANVVERWASIGTFFGAHPRLLVLCICAETYTLRGARLRQAKNACANKIQDARGGGC